jgi:ferritin-like protein
MTRWTIRGVGDEVVEMIRKVADLTGATHGELLTEIVADWYGQLPEADETLDVELAIQGEFAGP